MSVTDNTEGDQTEAIAFEFELAHPPEKVWRALTEPELLARWLLPVTGFVLEPGTTFRFQADPQEGWDGRVDGQMLEVDPTRRLRYRWVVGELDTVVTFSLSATASGTRMTMIQTGFKEGQKRNWGGARYGWRMMGEKLEGLLENTA